MKRISPTNDLGFKKVFASVENKDVLGGLINDTFGIVAEDIEIINPYSIDVFKDTNDINVLRQTLRDISVTFKTADFVSEMQVNKRAFFSERSIYYPLKRFCENYNIEGKMVLDTNGKPNRYSSLRPVYALNILGYKYFDDEEALRVFELYDPERKLYFNKQLLKIGYFEYEKADTYLTENQKHWKYYFETGDVKLNAPEYIQKASGIIEYVNLMEEERSMADAIEKAEATMQAEYSYAVNEALEKGMEKGIFQVAKSMLTEGIDFSLITKVTGLSLSQVQQLQKA